jgi:hypothetical protein
MVERDSVLADLTLPNSCIVPVFAELSSSPNVWQSENSSVRLQECQDRRAESRIDRDAEAAVSCFPIHTS